MATCAECGSENPDGSRFCGSCGKPLPTAEAEAAAPEEDVSSTPTTEQPAGYTPEHAAYNEALAAINAPSSAGAPTTEEPAATTEQPAATVQQPPVTTAMAPTPAPTAPLPPMTSTIPPTVAASGRGGPNKKVLAIVGGGVALLLILGAVWFFFIRDDPEPASNNTRLSDEFFGSDPTDEEEVTDDASDAPVAGEDPAGDASFEAIAPYVVQSAGPYSITQESANPCTPPCIFPPEAHDGSLETYQVTWDAGSPASKIFGEFLRYPSSNEALVGVEQTIGFLESSGYQEVDTFTLNGVPGTVYQSPDSEILLYQESNLMMGLFGNKGYPIEFVGYLGP